MKKCIYCGDILAKRHQFKFCSNRCQADDKYRQWLEDWRRGEVSGGVGITARTISGHLRKYLIDKFESKCSICGWNKRHPITGVAPLEIDHIDGNSENNSEYNLRLLCPNCHALTPFYKNLNKGNGRKWRMDKYVKNSR